VYCPETISNMLIVS